MPGPRKHIVHRVTEKALKAANWALPRRLLDGRSRKKR
jgi:hypothetical protein